MEGGNSAALVAAAMMDRMDRSDTLGGILEAITDILGAVLNGTDAQVRACWAPCVGRCGHAREFPIGTGISGYWKAGEEFCRPAAGGGALCLSR